MMYSLYRAWFGDSTVEESYSHLQETLSPPDTVVRVGNEGEHQFVAHKGVLAAHSGYLKALLTNAATTPNSSVNANINSCTNLPTTAIAVTTTNILGQSSRQPVTSVSVSSIGGEAFAPLLNYMYTGRLEVTLDNVYSVLLATHLLHMPGALEQCRAALLRLRPPPPLPTPIPIPTGSTSTLTSTPISTSTPGSGNILRPIPNRLVIDPSMCWPPTAPLYPSTAPATASLGIPHLPQLQPSVLMQSTAPISVSVVPTSNVPETQNSTCYSEVSSPKPSFFQIERNRSSRVDSRQKSPESVSSTSVPFVSAASVTFTAFATSSTATSTRTLSPTQSMSPSPSSTSPSLLLLRQNKKLVSSTKERQSKKEYNHERVNSNPVQNRASPLTTVKETTVSCNRAETSSIAENDRGRSSRRKGRETSNGGIDDSSSSGVLSVVYDVACCDGPVKFHRVLNENYSSTSCTSSPISQPRLQRSCFESENTLSENDENGGPRDVRTVYDPIESSIETANSGASYTCEYCKHTFKSHYCYKKHTKRHLLAARMNDTIATRQRQEGTRSRREVRLLDLNVQYYPCKICGCKFPSYYFVHKHRKLCHANIEERSQSDETNSTPPEDPETNTSTSNERPMD